MARNLVEISTFTTPITVPENGEPAQRETDDPPLQALANRTKFLNDARAALVVTDADHESRIAAVEAWNADTRLDGIEARIVSDEWRYPAFKVRTLEVLPSAFERAGVTASSIPWRFRPALGNAQTAKAAGTDRAELALQLNRLIPGNSVITAIWVMVTPGAARSGINRMSAVLYSREPSVYTPGSEALGAVAVVQSVSDDEGTGLQSMLLNSGADMTLGYAIWLNVLSGSGDTTDDTFHGVKIQYQDVGPINT